MTREKSERKKLFWKPGASVQEKMFPKSYL